MFNTQKAAYETLEKKEAQIKAELLKKEVLHHDESGLHMVKLKQKISGGFRSLLGAEMFARICGYISTLHKQNIDIADAMTALANGQPTCLIFLKLP